MRASRALVGLGLVAVALAIGGWRWMAGSPPVGGAKRAVVTPSRVAPPGVTLAEALRQYLDGAGRPIPARRPRVISGIAPRAFRGPGTCLVYGERCSKSPCVQFVQDTVATVTPSPAVCQRRLATPRILPVVAR